MALDVVAGGGETFYEEAEDQFESSSCRRVRRMDGFS